MRIYGGAAGLVVVERTDDTDGADLQLYLLDPSIATDETIEQPGPEGHTHFPRQRCVDKETSIRAALHFTRTAAPDPDLPWGW
jgi:hypothetical protein